MNIDKDQKPMRPNKVENNNKEDLHTLVKIGAVWRWIYDGRFTFKDEAECRAFLNNRDEYPLEAKYHILKDEKDKKVYWIVKPEMKFKDEEDCMEYWEKTKK